MAAIDPTDVMENDDDGMDNKSGPETDNESYGNQHAPVPH